MLVNAKFEVSYISLPELTIITYSGHFHQSLQLASRPRSMSEASEALISQLQSPVRSHHKFHEQC